MVPAETAVGLATGVTSDATLSTSLIKKSGHIANIVASVSAEHRYQKGKQKRSE